MSTLRVNNLTDLGGDVPDGVGRILQVVSTAKTDTFSSASTTFVDITGMSVSITPSSATSKIFVMAMVALSSASTDGGRQIVFVNLVRDSTTLFIGDAAGSRERTTIQHGATAGFNTAMSYIAEPSNLSFLDSPASTSALTYKLQIRTNSGSGRTAFLNRAGISDTDNDTFGRSVSSITLMEIAG